MPDLDLAAAVRRLAKAQAKAKRAKLGKPLAAPSDADLDALAAVGPENADSAEVAWDSAQRQAKTGLVGLLDAMVDDA
jgi:hypothetical protein